MIASSPEEVLDLLTEPDAIARWTPIPFEVLELEGRRLITGSRARVAGRLAGRSLEFDITVLEASDQRLELTAEGPVSIAVQYHLRPTRCGSDVHASVSVEGRGLLGTVLAKATEALLAAGALRTALDRIGREVRPALAA